LKLDEDRVRGTRERLGLTLAMVAQRAGTSKNTVLSAEHGADIRPTTARKIADALHVEIEDLLGEQTHPLAEAPPSQDPLFHNGGLEERGHLTTAEENAIETLDTVCDEIEGFLNDYLPSNRGTVSGENLMTSMRLLARVTAGLTLPYLERATTRTAMLQTATRLVEMVHQLEREAKESGAGADEEAENVIYLLERRARAS
jgi:DNA-binding XRE family transcriptional regulator